MTRSHWLLVLCAVVCMPPGWADDQPAVDLTKIARSVAREPEYSQPPRYCLLVFGPKAETRVWLVRDGDTLYVDRNGDGELTNEEKVARSPGTTVLDFRIGTISTRDGQEYRELSLIRSSQDRLFVNVPDRGRQMVGFGESEKLDFSTAADKAPIVHFGGALSLTQYSDKRVISRDPKRGGDRDRALRVMIGTPGLGAGTFAAYHCKMCDRHGPLSAQFEYRAAEGDSQIELTEPLLKIG